MSQVSGVRKAPRESLKAIDDAFVVSQLLDVLDKQPPKRGRRKGADLVELPADQYELILTVLRVIVSRGKLQLLQRETD